MDLSGSIQVMKIDTARFEYSLMITSGWRSERHNRFSIRREAVDFFTAEVLRIKEEASCQK